MLDTPADTAETARPRRRGHPDGAEPAPAPGVLITPTLLLGIVRRHQRLLWVSILLTPLAFAISLHAITPRYTATGTLLYEPPAYRMAELQSILRSDPITEAVLDSQAEVMRGLTMVQRVAEQLHLFDNPEFNADLRPRSLPARALHLLTAWLAQEHHAPPSVAAPGATRSTGVVGPALNDTRDATLTAVQKAFEVSPAHTSHVLVVSFTAEDPVLAAAAVNNLMDVYIKDQLGAKFRAVRKANDWLVGRVAELREQVRHGEDAIAAYRAKSGLIQGMHADLDTEKVSHLSEGLVQAQAELAAAEARLDAARGQQGAEAQAAIAPSVVQLRAQQDQLRAQLQGLDARLGPNHPDVINLRRQLIDTDRAVGAETARVVAAADAATRAVRERVATLAAALREAQQVVDRDAQAQIPLAAMQRDADAARALLQSVLGSIQETAQKAAVEAPDAHEISLALPPDTPSAPRVLPVMAGAVALGVMFGLLLVYIAEISDRTLRSGADVRRMLGLPCFALIPEIPARRLGRMPVSAYGVMNPQSHFTEQVRALRTGLWLGSGAPRVVAVTAARPAEGKTSVTLALARMAALGGERVCVLDCDVRQPAFGRLLLANGEIGLTDLLAGLVTDAEVLRQDTLSAMRFIPAGSVGTGPRPAAAGADAFTLFTSEAMVALLRRLRAQFDLVLLDAAPAQAMADTRVIAGIADATLLCLRWQSTPLGVAENALALLGQAGANVIGVVLTRIDARAHLRSGAADADMYHPRYGGYFRG
jgi:succinoglycan biosynthesis transport protein ExoP